MKDKILTVLFNVFVISMVLCAVALAGLSIYCWVVYGNLPPEEVPSWVHWLMWRRQYDIIKQIQN